MTRATVAIVGRMNVGKSTLFNRLTESKKAITSSWAGTTRDINIAPVLWRGVEFDLMDTGGLDVKHDEELEEQVINAARRATQEADLILFLIDGQTGLLPKDRELAKELRAGKKPVILVINKIDTDQKERSAPKSVYQLDMDTVFFISASNGRSTGDLLDAIYERLQLKETETVEIERTKVAIVGRPNVGKSSLLNAILGEEKVIVASEAHTTRDTNDIPYEYKGRDFLLIDTAGIRKQSHIGKKWSDKRLGQIERESVRASIAAMQRADVVLMVLEAQERVTAQDKKIADLANEYGKGLIIVVNKWDLIEEKDSNTIDEFRHFFDISLPFLRWAPIIFVSAMEKRRVRDALDLVAQVATNYERRVPKEGLDELLELVKTRYKPRQSRTRKFKKIIVKFKALTQKGIQPPRFELLVNKPKDIPKAIPDIIERELRDRYDFEGVKIIISNKK
ncbi:MAG: ribosome biogenesis GTPase Der [Candidatus Kerfeldbacteria bacterium]